MSDAVAGEARVAVAFSGGLDSTIVAKCAMREVEVVACTGFSAGSGDATRAKEAAAALGLGLVETRLTPVNVAEGLAGMDLPFQPTLMDKSLWVLYSLVARSARDSGARVMLLGQLADELFGGYAKYAEAMRVQGAEAARTMMDMDVREYAGRGRLRDVAACGRWVEPRFPFEGRQVMELATSMPVSFKMRDGVRKAVLRRAAAALGIPEGLAGTAKKAAQYSSGVQKLVAGSHF